MFADHLLFALLKLHTDSSQEASRPTASPAPCTGWGAAKSRRRSRVLSGAFPSVRGVLCGEPLQDSRDRRPGKTRSDYRAELARSAAVRC